MEERLDWQEVVARSPKGYLELNNGHRVLHGPIESIKINEEGMVVIKLKWTAKVMLDSRGLSTSEWEVVADNPAIMFPNFVLPFVIEDTPEKGDRVRFACLNILYINEVEGLDPARVKGLTLA